MKKIKLFEIASELGAGTRGASLGPSAIRTASIDYRSDFFKRYPVNFVPNCNELLLENVGSNAAKRLKGIVELGERMTQDLSAEIENNHFPIFLTGDHSNGAPCIASVKKAFPNKRLGVIWIDAHADLHTPFTTPSGNVHGMPLAASINEDNLECQENDPDRKTLELWERFKNLGNISPKLAPQDIVYIGLRDYEAPEERLIRRFGMKVLTPARVRLRSLEKLRREVYQHLEGCDIVYVSLDVDSMDPTVSRGTGTPVPGGLTKKETGNILLELMQNPKVAAFEITEVNPTLDTENVMAETAFDILRMVTNQIESTLKSTARKLIDKEDAKKS